MDDGRERAINPKEVAPPLKGHYSNSVKVTAGPLLFIAGQSIEAQCRCGGAGDLRAQATQVLENIRAIYAPTARKWKMSSASPSMSPTSALSTTSRNTPPIFSQDGPASATVEVSNLALPELMIEIAAVAAVP